MESPRAFLLRLLFSEGAGHRIAPPPASTERWARLLRTEACGSAVRAALREIEGAEDPAWDALARAAKTVATAEQKRILSARAALRRIAGIATERGWRVAVLKGGILLESDAPVDLMDVDVLAAPGVAREMAAALDAEGYARKGPESAYGYHLPVRHRPHEVSVEAHLAVQGMGDPALLLERTVPLEGAPGLHRLAPADHLRHVLYHAVVHHPERRGRIRDLIVLARALEACTADEVRTLRERIRERPHARALEAFLAMAAEARDGRPVRDRFARERSRLEHLRPLPLIGGVFGAGQAHKLGALLVVTDRPWGAELVDWLRRPMPGVSGLAPVGWLERTVRPVGRALRWTLRAGAGVLGVYVALGAWWRGRREMDPGSEAIVD